MIMIGSLSIAELIMSYDDGLSCLTKVLVVDDAVLPAGEQVNDDVIESPAVLADIFWRVVLVHVALQLIEIHRAIEVLPARD